MKTIIVVVFILISSVCYGQDEDYRRVLSENPNPYFAVVSEHCINGEMYIITWSYADGKKRVSKIMVGDFMHLSPVKCNPVKK